MKFRTTLKLIFIFVAMLALQGQAQTSQTGARLVVAEKQLGSDPQNKILLIGIDQEKNPYRSANASVDIRPYFKNPAGVSQSLSMVDPKFLFLVNRRGVQSIYAFNANKIKKGADLLSFNELPENLVDLRHFSRQTILRNPVERVIELGSKVGSATIQMSGLFSWLFKGEREVEKNREAIYLLELLDGALFDNRYPALMNYFPPQVVGNQQFPNKQLCDIGTVISLRYHPAAEQALLFARASNRLDLYCNHARALRDEASRQEERLLVAAQGQNIFVDRIGKHFSVVSYDPENYVANPDWIPHGMQTKSPQDLEEVLAKWRVKLDKKGHPGFGRELQAHDRVPYAIISESSNARYVTVLHFFEKNRQRQESLLRNLYHLATGLGAVATFQSPLAIPLNAAEDFFIFKLKEWKQSTFFENTAMSYGRLLAFLQVADAIDVDWSSTANDTWLYAIENEMRLTPQEREAFFAAVKDRSNRTARNQAINEIVSRVLISQSGTRVYHNGGEKEPLRLAEARTEHWQRFALWLDQPAHLQDLETKLTTWANEGDQKAERVAEKKKVQLAETEVKKAEKEKKIKRAQPFEGAVCLSGGALTTACTSTDSKPVQSRPVILFAADGLRPDLLNYYANKKMIKDGEPIDVIPNIKKYFLNRGASFKAFTQHTVSVSSFSTILTGVEPDYHGLIVASSDSRDPKVKLEDYLDYIPDNRMLAIAKPESRGLMRIHNAQIKWIADYAKAPLNITGLAPIHDDKFVNYKEAGIEAFKQRAHLAYEGAGGSSIIDIGQAEHVVKLIKEHPGQHRLIFSYFVTIDHVAHIHSSAVDRAVHTVDDGIGRVIEAAQNDPLLKDAVILLISDHGLSGGTEYEDPLRTYLPKEHFVDNEVFNILKMFDGDMPAYPEYRFAIGAIKPCEARDATSGFSYSTPFSLYNTAKGLRRLSPDTCRGQRAQRNAGRPGYDRGRTMYFEPQGDGRATAILLDDPSHPFQRKSYYQLTHYTNPEMKLAFEEATKKSLKWRPAVNMVSDMLYYKSASFQNTPEVRAAITRLNSLHPVDVFSMPIQGAKEKAELEKLAGLDDTATRDPILIQAISPDEHGMLSALVFIKDGANFRETYFRYVVIRGFNQNADGSFVGQAVKAPSFMIGQDPLHYKIAGNLIQSDWSSSEFVGLDPRVWYSDREILSLLIKNEELIHERETRPTALFAIARILTLNPYLKAKAPKYYSYVESQIPDFAVFANEGFHFNPDDLHQADHGGNRRSEVQTTLILSELGLADQNQSRREIATPVFTRDILPTILDYLGVNQSETQGESLRRYVEGAH